MKAILCGWFGVGSVGDEAGLRFIRRELPDWDLTVLVRNPDPVYGEQYGVKVERKLEYVTREEAAGRNLRGFNCGDSTEPVEQMLELLRGADLLLLGPGALFNEYNVGMLRGHMQEMWLMATLAGMVGCEYGIWAVSASRLQNRAMVAMAQDLINGSRFTILREYESLELLAQSGVQTDHCTVRPDPVLGLAEPQRFETGDGRLVVSVRPVGFGWDVKQYRAAIRAQIDRWHGPVQFIAHYRGDGGNDIDEALAILGDRPGTLVVPTSPEQALEVYRGASAVIATRMHAAALAMLGGAQEICPIAYDPKMIGLFSSVAGVEVSGTPESFGDQLIAGPWNLERHIRKLRDYERIIKGDAA